MRPYIVSIVAAVLNLPPLPAQAPPGDPLLRWMDKIAQEQLQLRENAVAAVRTVANAERRKEFVRRRILESLGGLPEYAGPLHARATGQMQADGYVIEKVIYERPRAEPRPQGAVGQNCRCRVTPKPRIVIFSPR